MFATYADRRLVQWAVELVADAAFEDYAVAAVAAGPDPSPQTTLPEDPRFARWGIHHAAVRWLVEVGETSGDYPRQMEFPGVLAERLARGIPSARTQYPGVGARDAFNLLEKTLRTGVCDG